MGSDLLETVSEAGQRLLEPDERVVAVVQGQPRGSTLARGGGGVAASAIGGKWAGKSKNAAEAAGLELTSPMALALTDRRLVVFGGKRSMGSGKLKEITELVSSAPLSAVDSIQVKRLLVGKTLTVAMQGGEVKLELPPGQDGKGFAEEFERMRAPA